MIAHALATSPTNLCPKTPGPGWPLERPEGMGICHQRYLTDTPESRVFIQPVMREMSPPLAGAWCQQQALGQLPTDSSQFGPTQSLQQGMEPSSSTNFSDLRSGSGARVRGQLGGLTCRPHLVAGFPPEGNKPPLLLTFLGSKVPPENIHQVPHPSRFRALVKFEQVSGRQ